MSLQLRSLRFKILLYAAIPVTIVIAITIGIFTNSMYFHLLHDSHRRMESEVQAAARDIEVQNLESMIVPKVMATAQVFGMFGEREESCEFSRQILAENPQFTAAYFGYEPNADGDDVAMAASDALPANVVASIDENKRFLPYWFRDHKDEKVLKIEPLVKMETSLYYQGNKNRFLGIDETKDVVLDKCPISESYTPEDRRAVAGVRGIMTEPYVYQGKLIVEQTYPIVVDGKFKGVAGVDRALRYIDNYVKELKPYKTADFFLISRRGRIISASTDATLNDDSKAKLAARRIEETPYHKLLADFYETDENTGARSVVDPVLQGNYVFAAAKVPTGDWTLVMRVCEKEIVAPVFATLRWVIAIALLGIPVVWIMLWWPATRIANRIGAAATAAKRVADGDLTGRVDTKNVAQDESGMLLRSVEAMITNLNALIGQVKHSSIRLLSTTTEIKAASAQQEQNVNDFGTSTHQIAAAVQQISSTSQQLVGTIGHANTVATDTADLAQDGVEGLDAMEGTMEELTTATGAISSRLAIISDKTTNISKVVNTITKVADQTNLLSLNASVEAEKAGEYGLGFSVVAREIRRLADQTAVATVDIEGMVKEMQASVAAGVTEMESFTKQVGTGVEEVNKVGQQLTAIMQQIQALPPQFETVIEGMQSQSDGAQQISNAINNLAETVKQSSDSAHEFSQAAASLQQVVMGVKGEVEKFKIHD